MGSLVKQESTTAVSMVDMLEQADMLVKSGLMPKEINTKEKCVSVAIFGKSHGLTFDEATIGGDVYVFESKGKLLMMVKSERKLEEMIKKIPGFHYDILIETNERLKVDFFRTMNGYQTKVSFDISTSDKDIAHLLSKDNWKYGKTMLWLTANRRLSLKWPDWKRMDAGQDIASIEVANEAINDLCEDNGNIVNRTTGEVVGKVESDPILEAEVVTDAPREPEPHEMEGYEEPTQSEPATSLFGDEAPTTQYKCNHSGCGKAITEKVWKYSLGVYKMALCVDHQKLYDKVG